MPLSDQQLEQLRDLIAEAWVDSCDPEALTTCFYNVQRAYLGECAEAEVLAHAALLDLPVNLPD